MTNPKENEQVNEELSIDELKSVSGGVFIGSPRDTVVKLKTPKKGDTN